MLLIVQVEGEDVIYRLITDLMDINKFPGLVLAQEYHSRWEIENTLDELKTHLNGRKTMIRSKNPREVVQEIYGWLIAHYCIRATMFDAATEKGVSPLRLSFTGSLKVMRRAIPVCQTNKKPELDNHYYSWMIAEISDLIIPPRQNRSNPRVVKKPRSKFNSCKPKYRGKGTILKIPNDAFCGCGTTIAVAQKLNRNWIGIDITYQSINLILKRLEDSFGKGILENINLNGIPKDMESAQQLALKKDDRTRKEFEKWAVLTYTLHSARQIV